MGIPFSLTHGHYDATRLPSQLQLITELNCIARQCSGRQLILQPQRNVWKPVKSVSLHSALAAAQCIVIGPVCL